MTPKTRASHVLGCKHLIPALSISSLSPVLKLGCATDLGEPSVVNNALFTVRLTLILTPLSAVR